VGLTHLKAQTETVDTPGGKFVVRGLSLDDVVAVCSGHVTTLSLLFNKIKANADATFSLTDSIGIFTLLATDAPKAAAMIIAVAASDDSAVTEKELIAARKLAFPAQIDALEKIAKLTFSTEADLKKVVEMIIRVANGTTSAISTIRQQA
jgi:hypothetical protein